LLVARKRRRNATMEVKDRMFVEKECYLAMQLGELV
jgi:hypothetical protein